MNENILEDVGDGSDLFARISPLGDSTHLENFDILNDDLPEIPSVGGSSTSRPLVSKDLNATSIYITSPISKPSGTKPCSRDLFFKELEVNFDIKVLDGVEIRKREHIKAKRMKGEALNDAENQAIVHSINARAEEFLGSSSPDPSTCKIMANILRRNLPETFATKQIVMTEYGPVPYNRNGKGGATLEKRLYTNYYNKISKVKSKVCPKSNNSTKPKLARKVYGLDENKWNMSSFASASDIEEAKLKVSELEKSDIYEEKLRLVSEGSLYLQKLFSSEEPFKVVEEIQGFFKGGPELLQYWLGIVSNENVNLIEKAEIQLRKVSLLIERFLVEKRERDFEVMLQKEKDQSLKVFGNETAYILLLIREIATFFKDKASKVFVEDGKHDDPQPDLNTPNLLISERVNHDPKSDYSHEILIRVRVGEKVLFPHVSLPSALASLVSLFFLWNLKYPVEMDNTMNLIQRYMCVFGLHEGARNKKGSLKGAYTKFQVCF